MNRKVTTLIIILGLAGIIWYAAAPFLTGGTKDYAGIVAEAEASDTPVFLQMSTPSCSICKRMQPYMFDIMNQLEGEMVFEIVNIEANPDIARKYAITAVPTQIFLDGNGEVVYRHEGYLPRQRIIEIVSGLGFSAS